MTRSDPQIQKLLEDIYLSAKRITDRLHNETREGFLGPGGVDIQDITARRLTIIGEASTALLKKFPEFCEKNSDIPLRQARGMRKSSCMIMMASSGKWYGIPPKRNSPNSLISSNLFCLKSREGINHSDHNKS